MAGNFRKKVMGSASLLLSFSLVMSGFRCDNEKDPEFVLMSFILPISIIPTGNQINLGDTLWISGSFPDTLLDYNSNQYFNLSNFDFKSKLCLRKLTNNELYISEQPGAFDNFQIVNKIGGLLQPNSICGNFVFVYETENYKYKIGVVAESSGIYCLNFLWPMDLHGLPEEQIDLRPVIDLGKTSDGRERIPVYEAFYFVVNESQTNFDLFKENCKAASLENPAPINVFYEQKGSFTFRVVE